MWLIRKENDMNKEKAKKFMDNLVEVNRMIEKHNDMMCYVYIGSVVVHGLEKIADALQLTRSYHTMDDGYVIIHVEYNGFDFADALKP